jgi:hypothetical protein
MSIFTPEDLILYLYQETSPEISQALQEQLSNDWSLQEKLEVLRTSAEQLNTALQSPRAEAVMNVLNYAREAITQEA